MATEICIACYRPRDGRGEELLAIVARHVPTLRAEGLATARPVLLLRSKDDGTLLEIFEWADAKASDRAHGNAAVMALWNEFGKVADFIPLRDLPDAAGPFPHFEPVDGVVR